MYDLPTTTRHRVIDDLSPTLSVTWRRLDSRVESSLWRFYDRGDSRVKSRVESLVNRVVSRPATCHNVIAGRRRTRFPERAENRFSGCAGNASRPRNKLRSPFTVFGWGRTPETGLTPAEWREFPRYALVRILCMP